MAEYQAAQDRMTKAGTEYVRGIPVVKIFQQTVYSVQGVSGGYRRLQQQSRTLSGGCMPCSSVCQFNLYRRSVRVSGSSGAVPCSRRTGKRQFLLALLPISFLCRIFSHHFHCACKIMFASSGMIVGQYRFGTDQSGDGGAYPGSTQSPTVPRSNKVEFKDVSFTYNGSESPALSHVSFTAEPGQTVALVGPSGGGKTTAASLIPRFLGCNVRRGGSRRSQCCLRSIRMSLWIRVAFVFQNNRLFKASILENVQASRPEATREQVMAALMAAQCKDILDKLPDGLDTQIGTGRNLSFRW